MLVAELAAPGDGGGMMSHTPQIVDHVRDLRKGGPLGGAAAPLQPSKDVAADVLDPAPVTREASSDKYGFAVAGDPLRG